jgi:hypothetical protein
MANKSTKRKGRKGGRPQEVDAEYVGWLLREHVLLKSVDLPVVHCIVQLLIREGALVPGESGLELTGHEGVLREVPERSAPKVKAAIEAFAQDNDRLAIVTYLFPHDESFHRFALQSKLPDALRDMIKSFSEIFRDLEWYFEDFVDGFGPEHKADGRLVVGFAIDWFGEKLSELRQHQKTAVAAVRREDGRPEEPKKPGLSPLSDLAREAAQLLVDLPISRGMTGKELAKSLRTTEDHVRGGIRNQLLPLGLKNHGGGRGYFFPEDVRVGVRKVLGE